MTRRERFLSYLTIITAVELVGWMAVKSGILLVHEWHRAGGERWWSILPLSGSIAAAAILLVLLRS